MTKETKFEMRKKHLKKLYNGMIVISGLTALLELILMIRGFVAFDLERVKHRLYLYSYIFLFLSSLVTGVILLLCGKQERHMKKAVYQSYIYLFCLLLWATFISTMDCIAHGDSSAMVYITVSMAIGALSLFTPLVYTLAFSAGGGVIILCSAIWREEALSSGFYINFIIFMALTIFINGHTYRLTRREFEVARSLEKLSYTDQLTCVYNRRRLDEVIEHYAAEHRSYLFILMDIDDFKTVNDTFGHPVGDRCLILTAQKLTEQFGDGVYRFGGDEFAVVSDLDFKTAGEKLDLINRDLKYAQADVDLHISAGIYQAAATDSPRRVFTRTDRALYQAKQAGKDRWAVYHEE